MKTKKILRIVCLILCFSMLFSLSACFGESSSTGGKSQSESAKRSKIKPDFDEVMENYNSAESKKSDFSADLNISFYRNDATNDYAAVSAIAKLNLTRTKKDDRVYTIGDVRIAQDTSNIFVNTYNTIRGSRDKTYNPADDLVASFLDGVTYYGMQLGFADGVYNVKAGRYLVENDQEQKTVWGAADETELPRLLNSRGVDIDMQISNYLMTILLFELGSPSNWSKEDAADKYYDVGHKCFNYSFLLDEKLLHRITFQQLSKLITAIEGVEFMSKFVDAYDQIEQYFKRWFSIGHSTVNAAVNEDKQPISMDTSFKVEINVPLSDLEEVLTLITPDEATSIVNAARLLVGPRGTRGQTDTLGIAIEFNLHERISYSSKSVSLKNVDEDLFLPIDAETYGRRMVFSAKPQKEQPDVPAEDEQPDDAENGNKANDQEPDSDEGTDQKENETEDSGAEDSSEE